MIVKNMIVITGANSVISDEEPSAFTRNFIFQAYKGQLPDDVRAAVNRIIEWAQIGQHGEHGPELGFTPELDVGNSDYTLPLYHE